MLHSGIDLHKRTVVISTVDPEGHSVRDAELPTSRARIQSYFSSLPGPHRAVVESTSNWYWLSDLLLSGGIDLRLGHSKYIKAISYAKVKTDAWDRQARGLHHHPRGRWNRALPGCTRLCLLLPSRARRR